MAFDDMLPWEPTPWWKQFFLKKPKWQRRIHFVGAYPFQTDINEVTYHGPFPDELRARVPYVPPRQSGSV